MASAIGVHRGDRRSFPGGEQCILIVNFVHSVVCSALIVGGWVVSCGAKSLNWG